MDERLVVEELRGLGIATVMAKKGVVSDAVGAILDIELPSRPGAVYADDRTVVGTGPGSWLIVKADAAPEFSNQLASALAAVASVSDQSGGYSVTRLAGPLARTLLQRGAGIDFHPDSFSAGSAVTTVIAHIGVIIWQVDERPTYHVATFASYSHSFRQWLDATATALLSPWNENL